MTDMSRTVSVRPATLHEAFFESAERHADKAALKGSGGLGRSYTYGEAADLVRRFAAGLRTAGLAELGEIGLLSENRPEWPLAHLGILAAGCTVVPIDANLRDKEISYIAGHAHLGAIICSRRFEDLVADLPGVRLISLEEDSAHGWLKLLGQPDDLPCVESEVAALIYTSGTTGTPKAVELTHRNILANFVGIENAIRFDEEDTFLSVLPLHHMFETSTGYVTALLSGCTVVYARSLKSKDILEDIRHNEVTIMCGVPLLFEKMYHSIRKGIAAAPSSRRILFRSLYGSSVVAWQTGVKLGKTLFKGMRERAGLGSIRLFVSGGAAISPKICRFFNMIGFDFLQGYGLTECSPVVSFNRPDNIKFGSVGPPLDNIEVDIYAPGHDGVGEVIVRGESTTRGYRDNPAATAELLRDGWLFTGDLGLMAGGHLWITGRRRNLIVSAAGKNIYPEELEEKLMAIAEISEAVVFGRPKEGRQGEEVRALIVPDLDYLAGEIGIDPEKPDMEKIRATVDEAVATVNSHMATYKRIGAWDVQLEELEKTSTRKVKRFRYK